MIPRIIHQTSRTADIPRSWKAYQLRVRAIHPGWQYHHWTDTDNLELVRKAVPQWLPLYESLQKGVMKADMIRYVYLKVFGGLYLDFDYEMLKPFDLLHESLVLPQARDSRDAEGFALGNCIIASEQGHPFWDVVIEEMKRGIRTLRRAPLEDEVMDLTGPGLLSDVYKRRSGGWPDACVPPRMEFHPPLPRDQREHEALVISGIVYGIHHCDGTWTARSPLQRIARRITYLLAGRRGRRFN